MRLVGCKKYPFDQNGKPRRTLHFIEKRIDKPQQRAHSKKRDKNDF